MRCERSRGPAGRGWAVLAAGVVVAGLAAGGAAEEPEPAAEEPRTDARALAVARAMADRIAAAERFAVRGEIAWDTVQADGRTLEFGATREIVVRRPDRLRVELVPREGGARRLLYDGAQLVLQDLENEVYATVARSGALDEAAEYAGLRLGVPVALAELLSPDLPKLLTDGLGDASYVGEETLDGEACDHVSLRNQVGGVQLWVAREDSLPRQITITYEHQEGQPQFRARFTGWDLAPKAPDSLFSFEPPADAERIVFAPTPASRPGEGGR